MKVLKLLCGMAVTAAVSLTATLSWAASMLKFAHVYEVSHPLHSAALAAAEQVEKATDGRVKIEVFPASALGKEDAINEGLSLGTVDIIYTGAGFAGTSYGPISITDFPFTLRDLDHWKLYRDSDLFRELADGYKDATGGNEIVAISYYGSRHVTSNKPVTKPEDMKGLKIRVPNAPAYLLFPKALGANPTPMAFSEVYLGLQQGVVDAQENPLTTIQAKKFYEVQTNINLTGHITNSILTVTTSRLLDSLSEEDRSSVIKALQDTAATAGDEIEKAEQELVTWFEEKNITVNTVDREPFIAAVKPALTAGDLPFSPELYERLQSLSGSN
ncbi:sialic acid TRAP transporter substrate-binding protein SiaP [Ahrensia marina]|uniref:ABC transporter substrate-binding protein n=1 Tax=Ahrensia marina TaxID=1514904 RepID=A0A0N0E6P0_9HYPH|nr:sialic acid TRAP transporter substrate-binding protein SiaP [Ahrensia marina]KPB00248.1 ABC transporter substrate-binding protein [Ahrensia marina]